MTPAPARRAALLKAAAASAVALAILITLGIWQLQRRTWKAGILTQIDAAEAQPPRPLGREVPPLFTRVTASGVLAGSPTALYGAEVRDGRLGAQLVERLDRADGPPLVVILGWVPTETARPVSVAGPATVAGYVRLPERATWLSAPDDPEGRRFYTMDPAKLAQAVGAQGAPLFVLVAEDPHPARSGPPVPADSLPRPTNNHLQYAFTWFGLAASLVGVFLAFAFKREA